ncbi:MAG: hypothetical protein DRP57_01660 [Spirochaetes bacterium]|nr:MAG: hypothetical protein DRP57_01660 [Spirochaetota bacterium]
MFKKAVYALLEKERFILSESLLYDSTGPHPSGRSMQYPASCTCICAAEDGNKASTHKTAINRDSGLKSRAFGSFKAFRRLIKLNAPLTVQLYRQNSTILPSKTV